MKRSPVVGFTLVELLVVLAIIGVLLAILLPAVQSARESSRSNSCRNNLKQLHLAFFSYDTTHKRLPGWNNDIEDILSTTPEIEWPTRGRVGSWVIKLFPYLEQDALWDRWSTDFTTPPDLSIAPGIDLLVCPSDPPDTPRQPWLDYVPNVGQGRCDPTRVNLLPRFENPANGVLVFGCQNLWILDAAVDPPKKRRLFGNQMSMERIKDGTNQTLLLSENVHMWYYECDGDSSTPEFEPAFAGAPLSKDTCPGARMPHAFGFIWRNNPEGIERINGDNDYDAIEDALFPRNMGDFKRCAPTINHPNIYESWSYPSSNHPGGVNTAFCGGQIRSLSDAIEPQIYVQLMTSDYRRSDFIHDGVQDRKLAQPTDADF